MTPTQSAVLNALRAIRAEGEALPRDPRLTPHENNERIGVYADGSRIGNVATRASIRIPGASVRTLRALADAGHVHCIGGVWIATPLRESLCTPMTVGEAAIAASTVR
jgi:hypothetical protein